MWPVIPRLIGAALAGTMSISLCAPQPALAQPAIKHITPGALTPGKTTEISLHGTKLDGDVHVWTSFPAHVETTSADTNQKERTQLTCKVTVGAGVAVGIGGIVVATPSGVSDIAYVMIDDLPSVADNGQNHAPGEPQEIALPVAIDGLCDGTLADHYRFLAKRGEPISCEVVATRLGWDFDPLVRVLDSRGTELKLSDDDPASGSDPRFVFTAPADGKYTLELRDNRFKPGGRYRLRIGDFPLVSTTLPLVAQRGTPTDISFRGSKGDSLESLTFMLSRLTVLPVGNSDGWDTFNLSTRLPGRTSSGWTSLGVSELSVNIESPSTGVNDSTAVELPCVASGTLEAPGERDRFQFTAKKGISLRFRAITRSLGSPAVISLVVLDTAGKQLAASTVTDSDEPALSFNPPADGTFILAVEDLAGRGGGDFTYAVECKSGPQFSLLLKNDKINRLRHSLPAGGAFYLDVQCQRASYDGPVVLTVDSPTPGWQVFNHRIAARTNEVRMYVMAPLDFAPGDLAELRVVGRAESEQAAASMTTTLQLRAARPQMPYPPRWYDGAIFVSGLAPKPAFFSVTARTSSVELGRSEGSAKLSLEFARLDEKFKEALTVLPLGLPPGVTAEIKREASGPKETYDLIFKAAKNLPLGEHPIRFFAYAELAGQGRGVVSGDIRLKVGDNEKPTAVAEAKKP
jgi:hypothetical protein